MKALILTTVLILGLAATNHGKPINNIYSMKDPIVTLDEPYVDDIPFNTWEIAVGAIMDGNEVKMGEEGYVDDIPFDTRKIANQVLLKKIEENDGEANVNDIPFSTEKIMYTELATRLTENYRNEANTCDLPEKEIYISDNEMGISFYVPFRIVSIKTEQ